MSDTEWNYVTYKTVKNHKPPKYVQTFSRSPIETDRKLTNKEQILLEKEVEKHNIRMVGCFCCDAYKISDIICRTVIPCRKNDCYCCSGDDLYTHEQDTILSFNIYNKEYHHTRDTEYKT